MNLKKPLFWNLKKPNFLSYILIPFTIPIILNNYLLKIRKKIKFSNIKSICVGNIYLGGTGKTSLSLTINKILNEKKIRTCFIKKFYSNQIDELKILENNGKLFTSKKRINSLKQAEKEGYKVAILDDGLQDFSINYDLKIVCFNNINWIGNGLTIPSGPLRENIEKIKKYKNVFLNGNDENVEQIKKYIFEIDPNINVYQGKYVPKNLNEFDINENFLVFSGIGNHKTFSAMLKKYGLTIIKEFEFPDHYEYSKRDINNILVQANNLNCKIITTEKDFERMRNFKTNDIQYIKSDLKIVDEEKLIESIIQL
mgnify:CR=1 FL=1